MNRKTAIRIITEIFKTDSLGIACTISDEQTEAIKMALKVLEDPDVLTCGYCQKFVDEDIEGVGWCKRYDRYANCENDACGYYE